MEVVGQQRDQTLVLGDGTRPAVVQDDRDGVRVRRAGVHDVERLPVDHCRELFVLVEYGLLRTPVEAVAPVVRELSQIRQRGAAAEVGALVPARDGVGPAGVGEPSAQVVDVRLRDVDAERCEGVVLVHDRNVPG